MSYQDYAELTKEDVASDYSLRLDLITALTNSLRDYNIADTDKKTRKLDLIQKYRSSINSWNEDAVDYQNKLREDLPICKMLYQ